MNRRLLKAGGGVAAIALVAGCATPEDGGRPSGTGLGAGVGAAAGGLVGALVTSGSRAQGAAIGAIIGATLGGLTGFTMDRQRDQLEQRLAEERSRNDVEIRQLREDVLLLTLSGQLQFETGSAAIQPGLRNSLAKVADVLRANPGTEVGIIGHTDNTGSDAVNQPLSEARAYAVRNELLALGVPAQAMFTLGRGASEPRADNATEAGRAANRRVELVLTRPQTA